MKTIFITSFHPLVSRNILATPILDRLLREPEVRVVLLIPENRSKWRFFNGEFGSRGAIVATVIKEMDGYDDFFRYLALAALNTASLTVKRRGELQGIGSWLVRIIGNRRWARQAIRQLDHVFLPRDRFRQLIDAYKPDLIFATDVQNENDVRLMREARDRGIALVGMVRSWDNLTSKGLVRIVPDLLIVNNEIVKREAVIYHAIPEWLIRMVGIPHYDRYTAEPRASREMFFKKIGADPQKRLILFAPTGDRYLPQNTVDREVLELLCECAPKDCQILVRFPPQDSVNLEGFKDDGRVFFDRPSSRYTDIARKTELTREADQHLADTLTHADLVVSGPSTMAVDAAVFDKPVIFIGFDGKDRRPYDEGVRRYFDYNHQQPLLESGGVKLASNPGEFEMFLKEYLAHPERDREGRARIVREQCFRLDGGASERVADILLDYLIR